MLRRLLRKWMNRLPDDYLPSEEEPFMCEKHLAYFKRRLENWRREILEGTEETLEHLKLEDKHHPDMTDRASHETGRSIELRHRDRQRKLIAKIDAALKRIEEGGYGYCEETGEPIALQRLIVRPVANLSVEAQEKHEQEERIYAQE